jgi:membrane associated rhomboid family serine protease
MFIPLHDDNPLRVISFPFVTVTIIAVNIFVFIFVQSGLVGGAGEAATYAYAIIPCQLLGQTCASGIGAQIPVGFGAPEMITPLSYMFLHGSLMHLVGNMLFLWVFGDNVEDAMGHLRFLLFYLLCGVIAGYVHSVMAASAGTPLIGASGAVAGVIAAYLMLHPNVMVWALAFGALSVHLKAMWVLGAWVATQFFMLFSAQQGMTAWWAHIGGLAAGAALVLLFRRPGVRLFQ